MSFGDRHFLSTMMSACQRYSCYHELFKNLLFSKPCVGRAAGHGGYQLPTRDTALNLVEKGKKKKQERRFVASHGTHTATQLSCVQERFFIKHAHTTGGLTITN